MSRNRNRTLVTGLPIAICFVLGFSIAARASSITFTYTGSTQFWVVPDDVTSVNVLAVGGGGGGANGNQGGGGAGYVNVATIAVSPGDSIPIVIGAGGHSGCVGCPSTTLGPGIPTSFGAFVAMGGHVVAGFNQGGQDGSSGGGAGCDGFGIGGTGGSGGADGGSCSSNSLPAGQGHFNYTSSLGLFVENNLSAGFGGLGGVGSGAGGGGAGGILINGVGTGGANGGAVTGGLGGNGYGAGGGAGGILAGLVQGGGNGANGLVYIEYATPVAAIPEPTSVALLGSGLSMLVVRARRRRRGITGN